MQKKPSKIANLNKSFEIFASKVTKAVGRPIAFIIAALIIIIWAFSGPVFHFSDTWQLIINTGTTIITFLMVFIIQQSQNKDTTAIHLKLDELIKAVENANNKMAGIEKLTEEEINKIKQR